MKHVLLPVLAILLCVSLQAQPAKKTAGKNSKPNEETVKPKSDMASQPQTLPYEINYSSQFAIGNPAHAKMVLDMYKAYETNNFSGENRFSDTATFILADGRMLRGAAAIGDALSQSRSSQSSSTFNISAVLPVRSVDKGGDWVLVWGTQSFGAGNNESTDFHSLWLVNKDNKIDHVHIFEGKPVME